ncbi:hypothetical protein BZB76_6423 [Actinomadura pelletieri DSM 43383]|uniref:AMIN-like domain-containing protein n=1 Tax=Actinomadura pelletieri DSM 43383 TaxID=1120940 RepID=A0A495Q9K1_9ACTN|nr:hypothetical protein [Actinomadura pelletieri]RKS68175.1 hypothetical protein BZB76_6423 [Actinomadura pelletieri DSM 43383]
MRALIGGSLTLVMSAAFVGVLGTPASAACDTAWGSLRKGTLTGVAKGPLERVRTGRHACYDRLVLDVAQSGFGHRVQYVDQVYMVASGERVPLRGGAKLEIIVQSPVESGYPSTSPDLADISGYTTFRQVAGTGAFEGKATLGVGVRARLPFRVFTLPRDGGGTRFVVDVAHTW